MQKISEYLDVEKKLKKLLKLHKTANHMTAKHRFGPMPKSTAYGKNNLPIQKLRVLSVKNICNLLQNEV